MGWKPFLIVSRNKRNQSFSDFVAVRISSTSRQPLGDTVIEISDQNSGVYGKILTDDITVFNPNNHRMKMRCAVSDETMQKVEEGLKCLKILSHIADINSMKLLYKLNRLFWKIQTNIFDGKPRHGRRI